MDEADASEVRVFVQNCRRWERRAWIIVTGNLRGLYVIAACYDHIPPYLEVFESSNAADWFFDQKMSGLAKAGWVLTGDPYTVAVPPPGGGQTDAYLRDWIKDTVVPALPYRPGILR